MRKSRMSRITKGDRILLDSLDRSYLNTKRPFCSAEAVQAILITGNKQGRSFDMKINTRKLCAIFRKSDEYVEVSKTYSGKIYWVKE